MKLFKNPKSTPMKHLSKIEGYLKNSLSNEDRKLFDEECKTNTELVEELNAYLQGNQRFNQRKRDEMKRHYKEVKINIRQE